MTSTALERTVSKTNISPQPSTPPRPSARRKPSRRSSRRRLEPTCRFDGLDPLAESLKARVIGQDDATETLIGSLSRLVSGLRDPSRPMLTALLLGPTGVGKTETARAIAHGFFGSERAMTRINCEEYTHGHEVAKLLGSPPGYVGHNVEPLLSQARLDAAHVEQRASESETDESSLVENIAARNGNQPISVVLFDEIEKAHPVVWSSLLGILDEGNLTLGNNETTDFTRSVILMTSNVGSREMGDLLDPRPLGFAGSDAVTTDKQLEGVAIDAARHRFPPEFLNRFDETLVYSALDRDDLAGIFEKFLAEIHQRTVHQAGTPLLLKVSAAAADWIIERGTDRLMGARPLRRAVEHELVDPLSRLIASGQLEAGDVVEVKRKGDGLEFFRRRRKSRKVVA